MSFGLGGGIGDFGGSFGTTGYDSSAGGSFGLGGVSGPSVGNSAPSSSGSFGLGGFSGPSSGPGGTSSSFGTSGYDSSAGGSFGLGGFSGPSSGPGGTSGGGYSDPGGFGFDDFGSSPIGFSGAEFGDVYGAPSIGSDGFYSGMDTSQMGNAAFDAALGTLDTFGPAPGAFGPDGLAGLVGTFDTGRFGGSDPFAGSFGGLTDPTGFTQAQTAAMAPAGSFDMFGAMPAMPSVTSVDPAIAAAIGAMGRAQDERESLMFDPNAMNNAALSQVAFSPEVFAPQALVSNPAFAPTQAVAGLPSRNVETENVRGIPIGTTELDMLSRIAQAEAGNQGRIGRDAVVSTVMNRTAADAFPNSIAGVIGQRNQFEPVGRYGGVANLPAAPAQTQADVLAALARGGDPTRGATFFQNPDITAARGTNFAQGREPTAMIGQHAFYDGYGRGRTVDVPSYQAVVEPGLLGLPPSNAFGPASNAPGSAPVAMASAPSMSLGQLADMIAGAFTGGPPSAQAAPSQPAPSQQAIDMVTGGFPSRGPAMENAPYGSANSLGPEFYEDTSRALNAVGSPEMRAADAVAALQGALSSRDEARGQATPVEQAAATPSSFNAGFVDPGLFADRGRMDALQGALTDRAAAMRDALLAGPPSAQAAPQLVERDVTPINPATGLPGFQVTKEFTDRLPSIVAGSPPATRDEVEAVGARIADYYSGLNAMHDMQRGPMAPAMPAMAMDIPPAPVIGSPVDPNAAINVPQAFQNNPVQAVLPGYTAASAYDRNAFERNVVPQLFNAAAGLVPFGGLANAAAQLFGVPSIGQYISQNMIPSADPRHGDLMVAMMDNPTLGQGDGLSFDGFGQPPREEDDKGDDAKPAPVPSSRGRRYLGPGDDLLRYAIAGGEREFYEDDDEDEPGYAEGGRVKPQRGGGAAFQTGALKPSFDLSGAGSRIMGALSGMFGSGGMLNPTGGLVEPSVEGVVGAADFAADMLTPGPGIDDGLRQMRDARDAFGRGEYLDAAGMGLSGLLTAGADIPQLGMFAGKLARTADLDALTRAQRMAEAGADRRAIWDETGWFKGADGQWRFEIDDRPARFNDNITGERSYGSGAYSDAVTHPEFYRAYPDVARIDTSVDIMPQPGGSYLRPENREQLGLFDIGEEISAKGRTSRHAEGNILNPLLHEGQHAIQFREGFAPGGNLSVARDMSAEPLMGDIQALQDYIATTRRLVRSADEIGPFERSQLDSIADAEKELAALQSQIAGRPPTAFEAYQRLAGEVEARNVEARRDFWPADRRARPPWETQDVPDELQIIRGRTDGPQMSIGDDLPMDEASRMARMREMGYADEPFYRGEASGSLPDEYPAGRDFSRDKATSDGFAQRGGQPEAREFRLKVEKPLNINREMTLGEYADIVRAAGPDDAERLVRAAPIEGNWTVERFLRVANANRGIELMPGAQAMQLLEMNTSGAIDVLRRAGYDAIDSGRDVRMLKATGIRHKDAAFDPARAGEGGIFLGLGGLGALGATYPSEDQFEE